MSLQQLSSRAIIGRYFMRLEQAPGLQWIGAISNLFQSDQEQETYRWLGQAPAMREWIGGRQAKGLSANGITIENKHFEATLEIPVRDMRRDKTTQIMARVDDLADRTNAHWAKLLSPLINNGEALLAYDGQYFFDTDHAEGSSGTQSNLLSVTVTDLPTEVAGTATNPSVEQVNQAILKAISQMYGFKDDQGEPINENAREFFVMVPIPLWHVAQGATLPQGVTSINSTMLRVMDNLNMTVVPNPRLTWTSDFAVFRTDAAIKPLIRQEETAVSLKAIAEGSELEFEHDVHRYGVDAWRNVGNGMWQYACKVKLT